MANELEKQQEEWTDITPPEKKLIWWTLGIGITLLVFFLILFRVIIPPPSVG
ncbi:hypothetical protein [Ammonifex thiophilus]|uniref:hypothetical protein n=1 Tax=Ammonifex thiophilus TaxID=444093 RepID=UPI001403B018|nr:hypothetical protein [Ammonifex thiophilus]